MAMWLTGICLAFFAVGLVAFIASIIEEVAEIIRRGGCGQTSKVLPGMGRPRTSRRLRRPLFRSNKQNGIAPGGHLDKRHRSRAPGWAPGNFGRTFGSGSWLNGHIARLTVATRPARLESDTFFRLCGLSLRWQEDNRADTVTTINK